MSPSMSRQSQMGRHSSRNSASPVRGGASPRRRSPSRRLRPSDSSPKRRSPPKRERSPRRRSPSHREGSPSYRKSSRRSNSPRRDKQLSREKSLRYKRSSSPMSRSPSPRSQRLRRSQAEREAERKTESERQRDRGKGSEKTKYIERERDDARDDVRDKRARKSGRDRDDAGSDGLRHGRSSSPPDHQHHNRHQSRSSPPRSRAHDEDSYSRGADQREDDDDSLSKMKAVEEALDSKKKQEPSFAYSGKLAEETNRVRGITLLFNEPPDARKPTIRWRLYVFKGGEVLNEPLYVHRNSCYLFGRERRIADIPTDHPSCSKQHAVLQYRQVEKALSDGKVKKEVRPYVMDLGSTNKTFLNDNPIEPQRYYELFEKDVIKFGNSSREYVLLHEQSAT